MVAAAPPPTFHAAGLDFGDNPTFFSVSAVPDDKDNEGDEC